MNYNITFGTRKVARGASFQKYEDTAVVTVEGEKEAGKSRRMLFNRLAMDTLKMEEGVTQEILFGFVEQDEDGNRHLLIANVTGETVNDAVTYTTSKNRIAYDDTKEKGKGVTSKVLMKEISDFLETSLDTQHEYNLVPFQVDNVDLNLFELVRVGHENTAQGNDSIPVPVEDTQEPVEDVKEDIAPVEFQNESTNPIGNIPIEQDAFMSESNESEEVEY